MTPRDTRAEIAQKLSEILLGMDHATGDRNLQIWIATEGINEALALLRAPETQERGWQPISTAPKDGTPVCLKYHVHTRGGEDIECRASFDGTEWRIEGGGVLAFHAPMGWQPISSPPAQTEDR